MIIIIAINVLALLWIITRLHDIEKEVKKGNKDSQEVKTRLTALRKNVKKLINYYDLWKKKYRKRKKKERPLETLSGDQLELLRKALKINKEIASGLLKKWWGGGHDETKQSGNIKQTRLTKNS